MDRDFIPTFGVEIHAELLTNSKAFSPSRAAIAKKPNINVNPIDLGHPGQKPLPNKKMVNFAYRLANTLKMQIDPIILFDRKNYFYPDLAKGYQITQFYNPIGRNGFFEIVKSDGTTKKINILQIQMEEDTAKQIIKGSKTFLDFSRAGIPLIEIISNFEELSSIEEVLLYVKQLREQLIQIEINDGKLFKGSLRIDINVSIRENKKSDYGTRVEIKNLNSFANIKAALEYEINLQELTLKNNQIINMVTKRWDEKELKAITMRDKTAQKNYNFFQEQNINPIKLDKETIESFNNYEIFFVPEFRKKYSKLLKQDQLELILENKNFTQLFLRLFPDFDLNKIVGFITSTIIGVVKKDNIENPKYDLELLAACFELLFMNKVTKKEINHLIKTSLLGEDITDLIKQANDKKQLSEVEIKHLINKIFMNNEELINQFNTRPDRVLKTIMGQLMKESKGKINPKDANKLVSKFISEKQNDKD